MASDMTATPRANVGGLFVNSMPIEYLSLLVFPLFFWVFSFVFMAFEKVGILQQYRLRTPAEAEKLNKVTPWECAVNVLGNQILEFLAGILSLRLLGPGPLQGMWAASPRWVALGVLYSLELVGLDVNQLMAKMSAEPHHLEHQLVEFASSFVVPAMQFLVALFVADTWQYFAHRLFHTNKFLYRTVHSWHHRLYAPYTFGAQYIHPMEALCLDSIGNILSLSVSGLPTKLGIALSVFGAYNFIIDHCGYVFPFSVLPTECDTLFHDIHHQPWGLKSNYAVYFTFWDRLFGTLWTDRDAAMERYTRTHASETSKRSRK